MRGLLCSRMSTCHQWEVGARGQAGATCQTLAERRWLSTKIRCSVWPQPSPSAEVPGEGVHASCHPK